MNRPPHVRPVTPAARYRWREAHPGERRRLLGELVLSVFVLGLVFVLLFVLLPVMAG
ncbi:MAG TPA: hypothetical protein VLM76_10620 [Patescibacteria group bacterium]|nr:hypothetical protein [Patescibacteria group bacterium]